MAKVGAREITLTYLNIRQSISILIAKLIVLDVIIAGIVIGFYFAILNGEEIIVGLFGNVPVFLFVFITLGLFKTTLSVYVVLEWLFEYYELTPDYISHKSGMIFKKTEHYRLDHIRAIEVSSPLLGEILNYGTITLYDIRLEKELDMYLIHNPERYARVLKQLRPRLEEKSDKTALPLISPKEENRAD